MNMYMYLYKCIFVQFVCHTIHVAFCHILYSMVYTFNYVLYGHCMIEQKHIASLLLPPVTLFIVIYDCVGTNNETTIVVWYIDVDDDGAIR